MHGAGCRTRPGPSPPFEKSHPEAPSSASLPAARNCPPLFPKPGRRAEGPAWSGGNCWEGAGWGGVGSARGCCCLSRETQKVETEYIPEAESPAEPKSAKRGVKLLSRNAETGLAAPVPECLQSLVFVLWSAWELSRCRVCRNHCPLLGANLSTPAAAKTQSQTPSSAGTAI